MPAKPAHNDNALFKELGNDSEEALIRLHALYFSRLTEASFKVCKDKVMAKEIAFDCMETLWKMREKVSGMDNPAGWLFKCAKNKTANAMKARRRSRAISVKDEQTLPSPGNIQNSIENKEYSMQINSAIDQLAPQQRKIIQLGMDGFSRKEIAEACGLSESTIKKQIYNAYKNLRKIMKDHSGHY